MINEVGIKEDVAVVLEELSAPRCGVRRKAEEGGGERRRAESPLRIFSLPNIPFTSKTDPPPAVRGENDRQRAV